MAKSQMKIMKGLPGATIIIKGTTKGTVTDIEGFQLDVDENDIIEISFSQDTKNKKYQ